MKIHHIQVTVSDANESLKLYRDILGLRVVYDGVNPDGVFFMQEVSDAICHAENVKGRMVLLLADDGFMVELDEFINPKTTRSSREQAGYFPTGFKELAFRVEDIDGWFKKIKEAGYETTTPDIWCAGYGASRVRSFLCYDPDYNMIQFVMPAPGPDK